MVDNPEYLKFLANIEGTLLPQRYNSDEGNVIVINANYAINAGLDPVKEPNMVESGENTPYANIITAHRDDKYKPDIKALINVLYSVHYSALEAHKI